MTNEEIRKLLGGYATNSLTDAERKTLFQAALEDQDLFNAMQDEETLRDLLADPVSRAQVQRALEQPVRAKPAWWARRWTWAGASAVAAAVIIVGVVRINTASKRLEQAQVADSLSAPPQAPAPVASAETAREPATSKPAAQPPKVAAAASRQKDRKLTDSTARGNDDFRAGVREFDKEKKPGAAGGVVGGVAASPPTAAPAPPPPPPPAEVAQQRAQAPAQPAQSQATQSPAAPSQAAGQGGGGPSQNAAQNPAQNTAQNSNLQTPNAQNQTVNGAAPVARNERRDGQSIGSLVSSFAGRTVARNRTVNYVIVRRDASGNYLPLAPTDGLKAGDEVRLSVTPVVSGLLTLDLVDAAGATSRVFPAASAGLPVVSNASYTIPSSPITVKDTDQKYRIVLNVETPQAETTTGAIRGSMRKTESVAAQPSLKQGTSLQPVEVIIGPKKTP